MDDIFGRMEGRVKTSITDSNIMSMLHCKMDKAHERVHSKEGGIITRLHEISKFYELAVMQLEGCLKFVLEETDGGLESSDEEALGDLKEIRDRLEGRLRETDLAISQKDRELTERLENEMILRQALEIKDRELKSLHARLERTQTEGVGDNIVGNLASVDDDRDEEFSELKNSVVQQAWNIKQKPFLEDEVIDKRRNQGFESITIDQMSSDITILKETMDLAFGKMHSAIFLSEFDTTEQQSGWMIEKDVIVILIKGFMGDVREKLDAEFTRWHKQVFVALGNHLSGLMKEITCLQEELEPLSSSQCDTEDKISLTIEGKSSSEEDICGTPNDFTVRVRKVGEMEQCSDEDPEDDSNHYVAKMIKSHESIIRRKSKELRSKKREIIKKKGCSYSIGEKDLANTRQRIQDVTIKLEKFLHWSANLGQSFGYFGKEANEESSLMKMSCDFDMTVTEQAKSHDMDTFEMRDRISVSHDSNKELHKEIRMLKLEKEDANLQATILEDTYICLLKGLIYDTRTHLNTCDIEILVGKDKYEHILEERIKEWNEKLQGNMIGDQIREDMFYLVCRESLKDCSTDLDSALTECWDTRAESNYMEKQILEGTIREEISRSFLAEIFKEWNEAAERYGAERIVKEYLYQIAFEESIRDMANTGNPMICELKELKHSKNHMDCFPHGDNSFQFVEYSVKEDIFMVFLKEMFKEWKKERDYYNFECLIKEELYLLIMMEAATEALRRSGETEAQNQMTVLEDLASPHKLHRSLEIVKGDHWIENQGFKPKTINVQNFKCRACSEMKNYKTHPDIVGLKHEGLNNLQDTEELLAEIDSTSHSVCREVEKALQHMAISKGLLRELRSSLGVAIEDTKSFDDRMTPAIPFVHNVEPSQLQPEENEEAKANLSNSSFKPILEFSQAFMNFKRRAEKKIVLNILRVEKAIHYLNPLIDFLAFQRREHLLYREAFLRRCENLRRAEVEVDLLGDQVDALLELLKKIYRILHHHSPVLQQYFEVSDILKMIEEELIGAVRAPSK